MFKATTYLQLILISLALLVVGCSRAESLPTPTLTREPLIPTTTPTAEALSVIEATVVPTAEPLPSPTVPPTQIPTETPNPVPTITRDPIVPTATPDGSTLATSVDFGRFGLSGTIDSAQVAQDAGLPFSFYMNWLAHKNPPVPEGVDFWQMVRMKEGILDPSTEKIQVIAEANPGSVWLIGNEGDVKWQDSVSAETYATLYHEAYTAIKAIDPSATVSAGGIAQATPLRLAYLDNVLASYEAQFATTLPTDMWNIHAYALREERDSWGVDIPTGMDDVDTGELYEIDDHDDLTIFRLNIVRFRAWMAANGYQDMPLAVTEFSILLPFDYGFPPEVIGQFMHDAFDIMLELNNDTGFASDDNRLVQHWIWFWIEGSDDHYPWSNLYDSETQSLTQVGEAYRDYLLAPQP